MLSPKDLKELTRARNDDGIVSLYLRMEPRLAHERGLAASKFKSAYTRFQKRSPRPEWVKAASREHDRILDYLNVTDDLGRGLALFACEPANIWRTISLEVPVPTSFHVDSSPRTAILARVLDDYPRMVVALVQRDMATLYVSEQREAEELDQLTGGAPASHDQGGFSQARFERHIEFHVRKHLREVAERIDELSAETPFRRLVLGGTSEVTAELESLLPKHLGQRLAGTFTVDVKHDSDDEVMEQARELAAEAERREEAQLVSRVLDEVASGGRGVLGPEETVRAVVEGRAHKLVLLEDIECEGFRCLQCDYLALGAFEQCPVCGGTSEKSSNILDDVIERAFVGGVDLEFVSDAARDELLPKGGIGALLRY